MQKVVLRSHALLPPQNCVFKYLDPIRKKVSEVFFRLLNSLKELFCRSNPVQPKTAATSVAPLHPSRNSTNLITFYKGSTPNIDGETFDGIINSTNVDLENKHRYIQWLFPLGTASKYNPGAPLLDPAIIQAFRTDPQLRSNLFRAFQRMLPFYGLQWDPVSTDTSRLDHFAQRSAFWLKPHNHNFLRITRILKSLNILGQQEVAASFFAILHDIYLKEGHGIISVGTFQAWHEAARRM